MGHATRCVPIIKALLIKNNTIILGCTSLTEKILNDEFSQLEKIYLPEYNVAYSNILPLWFKLLLQFPHINSVIKAENKLVQKLVNSRKIDVVISDNRFGMYNSKVQSIIISHQLNLKTPFLNGLLREMNAKLMSKFGEVWVPDFEDKSKKLAGELSENKFGFNCKYIGLISRLEKVNSEIKYDYLFLLSGPEPSQTYLLNAIISKIKSISNKKFVIVSSSNSKTETNSNITLAILPNAKQLAELISQAKTIVCRSGYSTLMDMYLLEKEKLILIPTKGQTEQEYLAEFWKEKFSAVILKETEINQYQF